MTADTDEIQSELTKQIQDDMIKIPMEYTRHHLMSRLNGTNVKLVYAIPPTITTSSLPLAPQLDLYIYSSTVTLQMIKNVMQQYGMIKEITYQEMINGKPAKATVTFGNTHTQRIRLDDV